MSRSLSRAPFPSRRGDTRASRWLPTVPCLVGLLAAGRLSAADLAPVAPHVPVERCYGEGAPGPQPGEASGDGSAGFQFPDANRWSATVMSGSGLGQGDPTTITWSVVPDGTPITAVNTGESSAGSSLRSFLDGLYGSESVWRPLIQSALESWGAVTGTAYVYEPSDDGSPIAAGSAPGKLGVRGDVRISGHSIDGAGQNTQLAYNYYPPDGGDMVLDTDDGAWFGNPGKNSLRLRNIVAHEHGHGLGFHHVCPAGGKLMAYQVGTGIDGPQLDDILAGNRGYGDDAEPNDSAASATPIAVVAAGQPRSTSGLSIDDQSDQDYIAFQVAAGTAVDVTLAPVGTTYKEGGETSPGVCGATSSFNAGAQQDLGFDLIGSDGTTLVVPTVNVLPAGGTETLSSVTLAQAGTYYVRVFGTTPDKVQLYDLTVSVTVSVPVMTLYESPVPTPIAVPANAVATVSASPFDYPPQAGDRYYQIDDGTGNPARIQIVKGGSGLLLYFL